MAQDEHEYWHDYEYEGEYEHENEHGILILDAVKNGKAVEEPVFVDGDYAGYTPFRDVVPLYSEIRIGEYRDRVYATLKHNKTVKHTHIMSGSNFGFRLGYMGNDDFEGGMALSTSGDNVNLAMEANIGYKTVSIPFMLHIMLFSDDIYLIFGAQFYSDSSWDATFHTLYGLGYFITQNFGADFKSVLDPYKLKHHNFTLGLAYYFGI